MTTQLNITADLSFEVAVPGRSPVAGRLTGRGRRLQLRVDDPGAFAGRADSAAIRGVADALASRGLVVDVVTPEATLVSLGATRTSWLQRRVTGSRHIRVGGGRGVWTALRARVKAPNDALLPDGRLAPPPTMWPPAPTFLRRPVRRVTTTHTSYGGGDPRLVIAPDADSWAGERTPVFHLKEGTTTIGSAEECDIRLPGLQHRHAEVRQDADDEFVLVNLAAQSAVRVNGEPVRQRILRTASRVELGGRTLTYYREEYADHGRPYGGRIGGELGHQRPQPPRHRLHPEGDG